MGAGYGGEWVSGLESMRERRAGSNLFADTRRSHPVLDFISTTDRGRQVLAEHNARSEESECEWREQREGEILLFFSLTISDKILDQTHPVLCRSFTAPPISHSLALSLPLHHLMGTPCSVSDWLLCFQANGHRTNFIAMFVE